MEKKISWQHIDAAATSVLNLTCPHHVVVFAYWGLIHCLPFCPGSFKRYGRLKPIGIDFAPTLPVLLAGCGRFWSLPPSRRLITERKQTKTDQKRPIEATCASPENPCVGGSIPLLGTIESMVCGEQVSWAHLIWGQFGDNFVG